MKYILRSVLLLSLMVSPGFSMKNNPDDKKETPSLENLWKAVVKAAAQQNGGLEDEEETITFETEEHRNRCARNIIFTAFDYFSEKSSFQSPQDKKGTDLVAKLRHTLLDDKEPQKTTDSFRDIVQRYDVPVTNSTALCEQWKDMRSIFTLPNPV